MCLNSTRQRPTQLHASHKMVTIVEDNLVELLELVLPFLCECSFICAQSLYNDIDLIQPVPHIR